MTATELLGNPVIHLADLVHEDPVAVQFLHCLSGLSSPPCLQLKIENIELLRALSDAPFANECPTLFAQDLVLVLLGLPVGIIHRVIQRPIEVIQHPDVRVHLLQALSAMSEPFSVEPICFIAYAFSRQTKFEVLAT
ncbi:hypothetical protein [Haloferula sp.]|uniref:hypothetical protein n=1 Tax=Haloferula sp. TaxID=2497595 RepID=UPI003C733E79